MDHFQNYTKSEQYSILLNMIASLKQDPKSEEIFGDAKKLFQAYKVRNQFYTPLLHFLSTFYFNGTVKCVQKAE